MHNSSFGFLFDLYYQFYLSAISLPIFQFLNIFKDTIIIFVQYLKNLNNSEGEEK